MALSQLEQVKNLLNQAKNILITFPANHGGDAIGSALSMALFLEKLGKRVDVLSADFVLSNNHRFLPNAQKIITQVGALRKFIITLNLEHTPLGDLSYSVENNKLNVIVTPQSGSFQSSDVTTKTSDFIYDTIITIDTQDLSSLGALFTKNTEFFYHTTILNLDHSPSNEHFGQINIVNLNVPSTTEVVMEVLNYINAPFIDDDIATCLYLGLTTASQSFSSALVTPGTLELAAKLVTLGARREEIVTNLYRTKQLATLKLWGRALARLKNDSTRKLVWSVLTPDDFIKAGATPEQLPGVIEELISTAPEAGTVALIYESVANNSQVIVYAGAGQHALDLLKPFNAEGDKKIAKGKLPGQTVLEAEKVIVERLKQLIRPN